MTINELIVIMQNRILTLTEARKTAVISGDIERVTQIEADLISTVNTIEQLKKLVS